MPYERAMPGPPLHTAVETPSYRRAARDAGLGEEDLDAVLDAVMADPAAGELIPGSGGIRKVRIAKEETGKSGGYRALAYFMDRQAPVFLLYVIDKVDVENISDAQRNTLKKLAKAIKDERKRQDDERRKREGGRGPGKDEAGKAGGGKARAAGRRRR
jgi:hypothetical protein